MIYFLLFIQQFIASMTHIVGKEALETLSPSLALLLRSSIASIALFVITSIKEKKINLLKGIKKKDIWRLLLLGALNIPMNQFIYFIGLHLTTPADSALLYAMTPAIVFVILLATHVEKTNWKKTMGIAIAFAGAAIVMLEHGASFSSANTKGNILIFVAVTAWSIFTILGKPLIPKYGSLRVTAIHMIFGTVLFLPIGLLTADLSVIPSISGDIWLEILYLGLIGSAVNYILWYYALGKMDTSKVAIFQNMQPVITTVVAVILGIVILTLGLVGGGILALIGVLLVQGG